ncbi:MAG: hypothetical protein ACTSXW_01610 [Candidatus Baldrarchaeia archaeon]
MVNTVNTTKILYDPIIIFYHPTTTTQACTLWTLWLYSLTASLILTTVTAIILIKRKPKHAKTTFQ